MTDSGWRSLGALLAVNRTVGIVLVSLLFYFLARESAGQPAVVAGSSGRRA